jgi:hypothetical protein
MSDHATPLDIVSACQRRLAPLRKYEDNVVHQLNRINTRDPTACRDFFAHLQSLWTQRQAILDNANKSLDSSLIADSENALKTVFLFSMLLSHDSGILENVVGITI